MSMFVHSLILIATLKLKWFIYRTTTTTTTICLFVVVSVLDKQTWTLWLNNGSCAAPSNGHDWQNWITPLYRCLPFVWTFVFTSIQLAARICRWNMLGIYLNPAYVCMGLKPPPVASSQTALAYDKWCRPPWVSVGELTVTDWMTDCCDYYASII